MHTVRKIFQDICHKLNLEPHPPAKNLSPLEVKRYLTKNHLKFCVLLVDAETVKDAYVNLPQREVEYQELLEIAAKEVCKN